MDPWLISPPASLAPWFFFFSRNFAEPGEGRRTFEVPGFESYTPRGVHWTPGVGATRNGGLGVEPVELVGS